METLASSPVVARDATSSFFLRPDLRSSFLSPVLEDAADYLAMSRSRVTAPSELPPSSPLPERGDSGGRSPVSCLAEELDTSLLLNQSLNSTTMSPRRCLLDSLQECDAAARDECITMDTSISSMGSPLSAALAGRKRIREEDDSAPLKRREPLCSREPRGRWFLSAQESILGSPWGSSKAEVTPSPVRTRSSMAEATSPSPCPPRSTPRLEAGNNPRTRFKRANSMFQTEREFIGTADGVSSSGDPRLFRECQILPCIEVGQDAIKRITPDTLIHLLDNKYRGHYDQHYIVDCRFPYEYAGGHISGALNLNTPTALDQAFLTTIKPRSLIVFHCEFSIHRAPRMALYLRNRDRQMNIARYPRLHYPEVYVLEGGYAGFFEHYRGRCDPPRYVEMSEKGFEADCQKGMERFRKMFVRSRSVSDVTGWERGEQEERAARRLEKWRRPEQGLVDRPKPPAAAGLGLELARLGAKDCSGASSVLGPPVNLDGEEVGRHGLRKSHSEAGWA
ncbi:uncharacterized protein VTP21DRAFT_5869 [Calcarisporiella thermophila]|uniref:uncharacterized protein n=1 Tax=Calcarisporiella thermophila TaxID=911321 RepID=UPI0037434181